MQLNGVLVNRPGFEIDVIKTFWCVFLFTVPIVVYLQNTNAKFHKVVQRRYSGEVQNV